MADVAWNVWAIKSGRAEEWVGTVRAATWEEAWEEANETFEDVVEISGVELHLLVRASDK
jgi:hypothetical protein